MSGKCRPSLRAKTLENVKRSNLSQTDKNCIEAVFDKLTPKKPTDIKGRHWGKSKGGNCPICKSGVNSLEYHYCRRCGCKLDWSDTE